MTSKSICTGESSTAAPVVAILEVATADKLLLARMETFMSLAIVLAREGFPTDTADERTLVRMCAQMRSEVVGSSEALRTQRALEGCRMLLCALWVGAIRGRRSRRICKIQDVVAIGYA